MAKCKKHLVVLEVIAITLFHPDREDYSIPLGYLGSLVGIWTVKGFEVFSSLSFYLLILPNLFFNFTDMVIAFEVALDERILWVFYRFKWYNKKISLIKLII